MNTAHKVYLDKSKSKPGKPVYYVRVKTEKGWKTKYAPVSCNNESDVETWFCTVYDAPTVNADAPPIRTIASVAPLFLAYRSNDDNLQSYRGNLNNWILKSPIAHIDLEKGQEPKVCRDFIRSIPRAPFTVRNIVQTVRTLIDDARKENWIDFRTVNLFRDPIVTSAISEGRPVTKVIGDENTIALEKAQVQTFLACPKIATDRMVRYTLAIASGLRNAELSGLQWKDLDLDGADPLVRVERSLRKKEHKTLGPFKAPKKNSYRLIPLHPLAVERLKAWKEEGYEVFCGKKPEADSAVFPNSEGKVYHPNSALFIRADLAKAGLSPKFRCIDGSEADFDFHSTRRTFASLLELETGCERAKISALLGHKSGGVTAKHYLTKNRAACAEYVNKLPLTTKQ